MQEKWESVVWVAGDDDAHEDAMTRMKNMREWDRMQKVLIRGGNP